MVPHSALATGQGGAYPPVKFQKGLKKMNEGENAPRRRFSEQASALFERTGLAPMTGRILGWLLVAEPAEQSAEEIARALEASRGSVSMSTRLLIDIGIVERARVRGERRAFYRVRPGVWPELLRQNLTRLTDMRRLAERGLEVLGPGAADQRENLEEMLGLYTYFERSLPGLMEGWERQRHREGSQPEG
jgi:DNA-binding transcriptional regulator GbsR (MarR family)